MGRLAAAALFLLCTPTGVLHATMPRIPVTVRVRTTAGEPVRDAYVALIPVWRAWSEPLVEEITPTGTGTFHVPRGRYYVVAAAKTLQLSTEGPFTWTDDSGGSVDVSLKPLVKTTGTVTDENGAPMAGVRVAESRGAILPPFDKLSELAVRHLSSDWSTITDERGQWTLSLPAGTVPLLFTAGARTAQWRFYRADDSKPLSVVMTRGATLNVTSDRADALAVITLEREGSDPAGSVPNSWQRQVWARRIDSTSVTWSSLPAGVYSVYAKYPDPKFFMRRAVRLGTVTLEAGRMADLQVTLPAAPRPAGNVARLFLENADRNRDEIEAFGVNAAGRAQRVPSIAQDVIGGTLLHLDIDGVHAPFFATTADRFISATGAGDDPDDPPAPAALHPRADASLVVRPAEKDLPFPAAGSAVFRDCSKTKRVSVPTEIRKDGLTRFTAPAGCRTAVLSFVPFEPIVVTKPLHAGEQTLGEFLLHAAAAADVRVVRDPPGDLVPRAAVRVLVADDDAPRAMPAVAAEAVAGPDGWAHLEAIPVHRELQFLAEAPGGETSVPTERRAEPRGRVVVDPLAIPKPVTLTIAAKIKRSVRDLFPAAKVILVRVEPVDRRRDSERREQKPRDDDSLLRFEPLNPGRWRATALVTVAGTYAMLKIDEVELKAGETRRLDAELEPLVFQGRVTAGGTGVAARITLENRSVPDIVRQHFDSRADGTYYAVLPNRGAYGARAVRLDSQSDEMPLDDLSFEDPSRPVDIVLPETATVIAHVRSGGRGLLNVMVTASLTRSTSGQIEQTKRGRETDSNGAVKFDHLIAGEWVFSAHDPASGGGALKSVTVGGSDETEITLDMDAADRIRGTIRDPEGTPVPHARVDCVLLGATGIPARSSAETDIDGRYSMDVLSSQGSPSLCSVMVPSWGIVDAFKATTGAAADVQLPSATATLSIADWGLWYRPETFWLAAPDGRVIRLSSIAETIRFSGPLLQIPALATGHWKVIRIQSIPEWVALLTGQSAAMTAVAEVSLEPGSSRTIHIYADAATQGGAH